MAKTRPRFQTESIIKTWPMVRLGDVCEINLGKTPPRGNARFWDKGRRDGYKWLSIADLANTQGGSVFDSKEYISKDAVEEVGVPVVLAGTFLLSFKLTLGRTAIAGCDLYTNEAIAAMPVKPAFQELVDLQFLNLYCRFFDWEDFAAKDEKVLGKTLNKKKLAEVPLPLPPLSVQREIVARLERELAAVEKIKKGFEALAETAKAEFKAELKETFEEGCSCEKTWDEVFYTTTGKLDSNCAISDGKYPFFTCSKEVLRINEWAFDCEALLLAGNNAAGKYDVKHYVGKFNAYQRTYVLTLKNADWEYKLFQAQLENLLQYLQDKSKGTGTRYLTMGILRTLRFYVPEPFVQREVVARLDGAKAKAEKLEAKAREGVAACETMRKAILKEAFESE